jgi:hypothetical protein
MFAPWRRGAPPKNKKMFVKNKTEKFNLKEGVAQ